MKTDSKKRWKSVGGTNFISVVVDGNNGDNGSTGSRGLDNPKNK